MRITVRIDSELLEHAMELTGVSNKSELVRTALKSLVAREAGRRLALLGGTEKGLRPIPRRRFPAE